MTVVRSRWYPPRGGGYSSPIITVRVEGDVFMKKLTLAGIAALLFLACSSESSDEAVLRVGMGAEPASFDPHGQNDLPSSRVRSNIYEGLIYQDGELNIKPLLAESWETNEDGTLWTFNLRQGVKFHNGEEFDSEDAVFSLERARQSSQVNFLLASVEYVMALDKYTLALGLSYPFAPILNNLSHSSIAMLDKGTVETQGEGYASTLDGNIPIGTAPFKFDSYAQGVETRLVKNEDYWNSEAMAQVDVVLFKSYPDNSARKLAVEAGDVDIAYDIANSDYDSVKGNPALELVEFTDLSYAYMGFNMKNPKFQDPRVREAINLAIDVDSMIQARTILNGRGQEANSPIAPLAFGWADIPAYGYDPERAKELIQEAGVEGMDVAIWTNENPTRVQAATVAQAQLAEVGINASIKQMEWGAYLDGTANGDHEIFILGWVTSTGDADYGLYPLFHSASFGGAGNRTFYSNSEVDRLLDKGRWTTDAEERLGIYRQAQEIIMGDYVHVPLWYMVRVQALRKGVKGFYPNPAGKFALNTVYFEN